VKISTLASMSNLRLAWRRITTGGNQQYKKYFRHIYYAYEIALDDNLHDLRARLLSRAWKPHQPDRIYVPKPSGLQRPLTLLCLEDQVVLQALANVIASKTRAKRQPFLFRSVFSNVLDRPGSIFFFRDWHETYSAFSGKVERHYANGLKWVADFDLAAFYETISHELLLRTAYPRLCDTDDVRWIKECLGAWTSERAKNATGHGLPQGPIASALLAEVFLLPVDKAMARFEGYTRYVDDVRLFAKTELEIRKAVIQLEIQCRERGLIPQVDKYSVREARSLEQARGMLPSVGSSIDSADPRLPPRLAERLVEEAIGGRPLRIQDKSRARYVFYRARPSGRLLRLACTLLPRHPEHVDAFAAFLSQYDYRRSIRDCCLAELERTPYEYVQGELWHILARFYRHPKAFDAQKRRALVEQAIRILRDRRIGTALKWGAAHFACAAERRDGRGYSKFLRYQDSAILQAVIAPALPSAALKPGGVIIEYLRRTHIEPGLALAAGMLAEGVSLQSLGVDPLSLPSQVRHVYRKLGLAKAKASKVDVIGERISERFGVPSSGQWLRLLGSEYAHAAGLLTQAEAAFWSGPSYWLSHQNSFDQTVFLALQRHLLSSGNPAAISIRDRAGVLRDFGITLDPNNRFSRAFPTVAGAFREMNARRNKLPGAHPYEKRTGAQTRHLRAQERNRFVGLLRHAYTEFLTLCP
jgi:Reverse transcriptase (RNA-dependent DNA polymerase)